MSKEVSFIRENTSATMLLQKPKDAPLYRRVQTAAPTSNGKKPKERYLEPSEFLAQRRKLTARSRSNNRFCQSAAPNTSKNYEHQTVYDIETLIKHTERDPASNVYITTGLSRFRLLHEIINLNRTPMDFQTLSKLQKRENLIIQTNATKDERYVHLMDSLQPTKRFITHCLKKPIIYNAYQECELIANRYLKELREGNHNFSHVESAALPVVF